MSDRRAKPRWRAPIEYEPLSSQSPSPRVVPPAP